jgi:hypothetical protein
VPSNMFAFTPRVRRSAQSSIPTARAPKSRLPSPLPCIIRHAYIHQELGSKRQPRVSSILIKPYSYAREQAPRSRNFATDSPSGSSNQGASSAGPKSTMAIPSETPKQSSDGKAKLESAGAKTAVDLGGETMHKTNAEQRRADWRIVRNLSGNLWPKGWGPEARSTKGRVVLALTLLAGGKVSICAWTPSMELS